MRNDQRQRIPTRRLDVDDVDVFPVDSGRELRQRLQFSLATVNILAAQRPHAEPYNLRTLTAVIDTSFQRADSAFGVTWPGVTPTNPSPAVTVRGLPGSLALAKPWRVGHSWAFVPYAPSNAIDD